MFFVYKLNPRLRVIWGLIYKQKTFKTCSGWAGYHACTTEVWGFILFWYFLWLFSLFYFLRSNPIPRHRLNTNFATPVTRFSGFIYCSIPPFPVFTFLYESLYPPFVNENFPTKVLPLLLTERWQWKWDCRLNFAGLQTPRTDTKN